MTKSVSYSDAGVDIDAATRATDRIKELARATFNQRSNEAHAKGFGAQSLFFPEAFRHHQVERTDMLDAPLLGQFLRRAGNAKRTRNILALPSGIRPIGIERSRRWMKT